MTKDEALKLALEAIEAFLSAGTEAEEQDASDKLCEARAAIRKAQQRPQNCGTGYCSCIECLFGQPAQQEPVDFTSLLNEAEEIVRGKPVWKRFIDGTPLSNDIAVWMTVFAQDVARRTSPPASKPWVGLTDEERDYIWHTVGNSDAHGDVDGWSGRDVMNAIEAKLKEKNT